MAALVDDRAELREDTDRLADSTSPSTALMCAMFSGSLIRESQVMAGQ
jgi:hypothetical protein